MSKDSLGQFSVDLCTGQTCTGLSRERERERERRGNKKETGRESYSCRGQVPPPDTTLSSSTWNVARMLGMLIMFHLHPLDVINS